MNQDESKKKEIKLVIAIILLVNVIIFVGIFALYFGLYFTVSSLTVEEPNHESSYFEDILDESVLEELQNGTYAED